MQTSGIFGVINVAGHHNKGEHPKILNRLNEYEVLYEQREHT